MTSCPPPDKMSENTRRTRGEQGGFTDRYAAILQVVRESQDGVEPRLGFAKVSLFLLCPTKARYSFMPLVLLNASQFYLSCRCLAQIFCENGHDTCGLF